jgi:hypothetical protein
MPAASCFLPDNSPGLLLRPPGAFAILALAHGAGAGMTHPFLAALADALARCGVATLRYQFPFLEQRAGRPDPPAVLVRRVRAGVALAGSQGGLPLFAGGKSLGGRMTSTAQAQEPLPQVRGLVFFGFPLHPPGRPGGARAEHLGRVTIPMLFLQGTRDALAAPGLIRDVTGRLGPRVTLHEVEGADHAFAVLRRSGRTAEEVMQELAGTTADWMRGVLA